MIIPFRNEHVETWRSMLCPRLDDLPAVTLSEGNHGWVALHMRVSQVFPQSTVAQVSLRQVPGRSSERLSRGLVCCHSRLSEA